MNRYRVTVSVKETYIAVKEATFEVEAENEDKARDEAYDQAENHVRISSSDADHEETEIDVTAAEWIAGTEPPDGSIPRCDKTPDMFQGE